MTNKSVEGNRNNGGPGKLMEGQGNWKNSPLEECDSESGVVSIRKARMQQEHEDEKNRYKWEIRRCRTNGHQKERMSQRCQEQDLQLWKRRNTRHAKQSQPPMAAGKEMNEKKQDTHKPTS